MKFFLLKDKPGKIIILTFLIIVLCNIIVYADEEELDDNINYAEIVSSISNKAEDLNINSRAAIIYDRNSKEVIYGKNENEKRKMASTTKIMTAIVVIENGKLEDTVIVSKKAAGTGGSRVGLKVGDKATVSDLLYGLMLCSGNDAAVCLAEYCGGSVEGFAELMNNKANELNLINTHFVTPHGLDNDAHYTNAYELAVLSDYALKNNVFSNIVGTKNYTITINGNPRNISNTNELLGNYSGVYGIKTGFTNGANRCIVTACKKDNLDIIVVVLGADTKKFRTKDSVKLINYAFENFEDIDIKEKIKTEFNNWKKDNEKNVYINKGIKNNVNLNIQTPENTYITVNKKDKEDIKIDINALNYIEAPIKENQIIGNIKIRCNKNLKMIVNIASSEMIKKKNIQDYMSFFIKEII